MSASKAQAQPGDVNRNGQVVIRDTGLPGSDHGGTIFQMGCSKCGEVYGSNSSNVYERKCPNPSCQGGREGEPLE